MVSDIEYDRMIRDIREIRYKDGEDQKEINLCLILTVEEATWISRRIYEEVDRGIFKTKFEIKQSEHSVVFDMLLLLAGTAAGTAVVTITKRTINILFDDLEDYLERKRRRMRKKRVKN